MKTVGALAITFCAVIALARSNSGGHHTAGISPAHEALIPVGGAKLYSRVVGDGPAIIVLHGGPDFDHTYLLPEMDRLASSFRLIYYDQRGRGRSADHVQPEDVTLASEIDDLDRVRQFFHLDSVVLLGHSWGAVLALEYAIRNPQRVSRLIIVNPAPASTADRNQLLSEWMAKRPGDLKQKKAISESPAYKAGDPEAVSAYYRIHFKPAFARPKVYEQFMRRLSANFTTEGILKGRAIESRLVNETWARADYDLLPKLKNLRIPTLVIYGDHDMIPAATAEHIAHSIPNARLVILTDCGHFTYMECPQSFRKQVANFFATK
jgi:proline iminopeptidase